MTKASFVRTLALEALGRSMMADVAHVLGDAEVPVMPLKGVLLSATAYRSTSEGRGITDVDVLVREEHFARASRALVAHGFRVVIVDEASMELAHQSKPLSLDLHRRLFRRGLFALPTWELFARGTFDVNAFGQPVVLPDPRDAFAHAIGHFVKSRPTPAATTLAADLVALARHHGLRAAELARHLDEHGLARATRFALPIAGNADPRMEPLARAVLDALPEDPLGDRLAGWVERYLLDVRPGSLGSLLGQHALDRDLPRAARSASLHAFDTFALRAGRVSSSPSPWRARP